MIYVFLGDDIVTSRQEFVLFKQSLIEQNYSIVEINEANLNDLSKGLYQSLTLFETKTAFICENLFAKKTTREKFLPFDNNDKNTIVLDWEEECDEKSIKFSFSKTQIKQSKLGENIFKFLDAIYPGNKIQAIKTLATISKGINENMIMYMLIKKTKELIFVKNNITGKKKLASWQLARLHAQADKWESEKLVAFYEALFRIDVNNKTSSNYYPIKKSLDILFCYFI